MRVATLTALACTLCLFPTRVAAQDLTPAEKAFIDSHLAELVTVLPVRLQDPALQEAFSTPFYRLEVTLKEADGTSRNSMIVARVGDRLVSVARPSSDQDLPEVQKMIRPAFKLRDVSSGAAFQEALDTIFPIIGGDQETKAKTFWHAGSQWYFARGSFFDKKLGFVLETDGAGTIQSVKFTLKLP